VLLGAFQSRRGGLMPRAVTTGRCGNSMLVRLARLTELAARAGEWRHVRLVVTHGEEDSAHAELSPSRSSLSPGGLGMRRVKLYGQQHECPK
jgi:hypothetical protein